MLEKQTNCKFQYVPNVVDTEFFKPPKIAKCTEKFTFLDIAIWTKRKIKAGLIKSFAEKFLGTKYQLVIAGDGPENSNH